MKRARRLWRPRVTVTVTVTAYRRVPRVEKRLPLRKVGLMRRLRVVGLPKVVLPKVVLPKVILVVTPVTLRVTLRVVGLVSLLEVSRLEVSLLEVSLRVVRVMARTQSLRQMRLLPDAAWL